jgi:hypothetical protein
VVGVRGAGIWRCLFHDLHATLGYGFLEPVYRKGLAVELAYRGLSPANEVPFEIIHPSARFLFFLRLQRPF